MRLHDPGMPVADYRQFINRNLPLRERACESKAVYVRSR